MIRQVGEKRAQADIEHFIRYEFMARDAKTFRNYVQTNTPGIDINIEFEGELGGTFNSRFQFGSNFFWF